MCRPNAVYAAIAVLLCVYAGQTLFMLLMLCFCVHVQASRESLYPASDIFGDMSEDEEEEMMPWPLYVSIQSCNVLISESLQEDAQVCVCV
jgi:hypothetical protein